MSFETLEEQYGEDARRQAFDAGWFAVYEDEYAPMCRDCQFCAIPDERWFGVQEFGFCSRIGEYVFLADKVAAVQCEEFMA